MEFELCFARGKMKIINSDKNDNKEIMDRLYSRNGIFICSVAVFR